MITITVELDCRGDQNEAQIRSMLEILGQGIRLGLFFCGNNGDLSTIRLIDIKRTADALRMSVEAPNALVAEPLIIESIFLPVLDPDECPNALKKIILDPPLPKTPGSSPDPMSYVNKLASQGMMTIPEILDPTQPISIWIDLSFPLNTAQIEIFRQSIDVFEELIASAPFLSCADQDYSGLGQTQLNWLGSTRCQYWAEAIATHALWVPMVANLLFRGAAISGVKHVEIEQ